MSPENLRPLIARVEALRKDARGTEVDATLDEVLNYLRYQLPADDGTPLQFQMVVDAFHAKLPMLPKIRALTEPRRRALKGRLREHPTERFWDSYFGRVARSPFLTGVKTEWMAGFDWLLKPANMVKVLEGNYDPPHSGMSAGDDMALRLSDQAMQHAG